MGGFTKEMATSFVLPIILEKIKSFIDEFGKEEPEGFLRVRQEGTRVEGNWIHKKKGTCLFLCELHKRGLEALGVGSGVEGSTVVNIRKVKEVYQCVVTYKFDGLEPVTERCLLDDYIRSVAKNRNNDGPSH